MPKLYGFAIVGGVCAGILLYTIIFGAAFGASAGCKYIWCSCLFKQNQLLEELPRVISQNQLKAIAVQDIPDVAIKAQAGFRLQKIQCFGCCKFTSILRLVSVLVVPTFFPIAFCVRNINPGLKWTLVGIASAAAAFLFYSLIFSLAFSPTFGCDMKYAFCTFCVPRDTTFDSDYAQYLDLKSISLTQPKPIPTPQFPNYSETVPVMPQIVAPQITAPMQPPPIDLKFQMVI